VIGGPQSSCGLNRLNICRKKLAKPTYPLTPKGNLKTILNAQADSDKLLQPAFGFLLAFLGSTGGFINLFQLSY